MTPRYTQPITLTIANGATTSDICECGGFTHGLIYIPTTATAATLYFQVQLKDGGSYRRVYYNGSGGTTYGTVVSYNITHGAGDAITVRLPDEIFSAHRFKLEINADNAVAAGLSFEVSLQT